MATTPAHEAQKLFFEIGMAQRVKAGVALNELGLGFAQAHALRMLDPDEPIAMSALAERLFCAASHVTGLVDRLPAAGARGGPPSAPRERAVAPPRGGGALRDQVMPVMGGPPDAIAALPAADQRAL